MRADVTAAYVASAARIGAWAVVSAAVYRLAGPADFGMLALIRGTIGLLNYTAVGLTPALIRLLAEGAGTEEDRASLHAQRAIYSSGILVAAAAVFVGLLLSLLYAGFFDSLHVVPSALRRDAPLAALLIGIGTVLRLYSDASGALLQVRGHIALDSYLLAGADAFWAAATLALFAHPGVLAAAQAYAAAAALLVIARSAAVARLEAPVWPPTLSLVRAPYVRRLLSFGFLVLLSQLAEYFYAPTDYILIDHFFGARAVAQYAPAMQIDSGLLMLVMGLAAVLLPRAALAHTRGAYAALVRYYVRGTLATAALLLVGAVAIWALAPLLFRLWFGAHPPDTRPILALVLASTVIGGSAAVGRSILLGMGKMRAYAIAALLAGAANVIASYCFVKYAGLGLRGIIYGTLVAVIGRCAIWMPWYVFRQLRDAPREARIRRA